MAVPQASLGDTLGRGLDLELPKASEHASKEEAAEGWVEFGLVEQAYALQQPEDWRQLLCKYDRTQHHPGTPPGKSSPTPPAPT
jgi:hypothetical protein